MVQLPRTEPETTIVVTLFEALPDVLGRLRGASGQPVRLEIPAGCPLFLTAAEFRALREVAQDRRIGLTVVTDDPLRRQLAGVFALPVESKAQRGSGAGPAAPPPRPAVTDRVPRHERTGLPDLPPESDQGSPKAPRPPARARDERASPPPATTTRAPARAVAPDREPGGDAPRGGIAWPTDDAAGHGHRSRRSRRDQGVVETHEPTPASTAANGAPAAGGRQRLARLAPVGAALATAVPVGRRNGASRPTGRRWGLGRLAPGTAVLAALGALGAAGLVFGFALLFLAQATVDVTLRSEPVAADVRYQIGGADGGQAGGDENAELTIPTAPMEQRLTYAGSVPTTGKRAEPDVPARGRIRLVNPETESVTIPAGTTLASDAGIEYAFTAEVTVPSGDPGLGEYGEAEAEVEATRPGAVGNLGRGELSGQLENGVYYSNRDAAIEGGADREVRTVAAADVQALRQQAIDDLNRQGREGIGGALAPGTMVVPASVEVGELTTEFSHQPGDDAETLEATVTAPVSALTYRPADIEASATALLQEKLAAAAPPGHRFDPGSLTLGPPEPVGDAADGIYRVAAQGRALAEFPEDRQDALAEELAGKDDDDAREILAADPAIADWETDYRPGWLPNRMPFSEDRIAIEVGG